MFKCWAIGGRCFAGVSLGFLAVSLCLLPCPAQASAATSSSRRAQASAQFARAEEMRAALEEKPADKRTLAEYKKVVTTYQRVYLITPHAVEAPDSIVAMGELNTEMGDHFGRSYYQAAADAYQFLIREYPTSKHDPDVMLRLGQLQKYQLADLAGASKTYQDFLKKYPRSDHKREVQEALAELTLMKSAETGAALDASAPQPTAPAPLRESRGSKEAAVEPVARVSGSTSGGEESQSGEVPQVRHIRCSATSSGTEVMIDLEDSVQFISGRIANPDRIYFDLHAAKLSPALAKSDIRVTGNQISRIRVAQNHGGVVRVVFDVEGVKDYAASLMHKPDRLVIELYSEKGAVQTARDSDSNPAPRTGTTESSKPAASTAASKQNSGAGAGAGTVFVAESNPASDRVASVPVKVVTSNTIHRAVPTKPDLILPPTAPLPTRDGESTLTRTLGLKINRIVIDPGHGGHDTGTIGPTGLMEKDLCLDVALRLGKIIQQKLPGAEILYTRSDDTFIPLEERTRIANEAKADLFISIHANSSPDHGARGIETYYLNLKGSADAMAVAARENASSQQGVHDLEDLVKKIAQTEKIDESKEFAEDVQTSLTKRIQKTARPVKNRGVRKAPFVVLIGADMPSILTEISFLSNPSDEKLLKKPEHRQRVAEGIYQGVSQYLESMNSVAMNQSSKPGRVTPARTVEQSRNQQ